MPVLKLQQLPLGSFEMLISFGRCSPLCMPPLTPHTRQHHVLVWVGHGGLKVLELGCGNGLVSLAAARLGAQVLATDYRQLPLDLLLGLVRRWSSRVEGLGSGEWNQACFCRSFLLLSQTRPMGLP